MEKQDSATCQGSCKNCKLCKIFDTSQKILQTLQLRRVNDWVHMKTAKTYPVTLSGLAHILLLFVLMGQSPLLCEAH